MGELESNTEFVKDCAKNNRKEFLDLIEEIQKCENISEIELSARYVGDKKYKYSENFGESDEDEDL